MSKKDYYNSDKLIIILILIIKRSFRLGFKPFVFRIFVLVQIIRVSSLFNISVRLTIVRCNSEIHY